MKTRLAYVREQLSTILGVPVEPTPDVAMRWWGALTRQPERATPGDAHGNYPVSAMTAEELEHPPLHADIAALQRAYPGGPPRWPAGKRFAACLTHDVDRIVARPWRERVRQLAALREATPLVQQARWTLGAAIYATASAVGLSGGAVYDPWLAEERRHGFHSTFFVLPERLARPTTHDHYYRYADRVQVEGRRATFAEATREVNLAGWEIGLHGSYASAYDAQLLAGEKAQVEEMLDAGIRSVRQHYLRFAVAQTPHVQARAGFAADSTLGFSAAIGCRAGLAFPFYWAEESGLLEAPLIIQDVGLACLCGHIAHPAALARAEALIARIAEVGGLVTLSWHTHSQAPGALAGYRRLLDVVDVLDGWGCALGELSDWWGVRRHAVSARAGPPSPWPHGTFNATDEEHSNI